MRDYLLILNGKVVADFRTYGRALNAFRRCMLEINQNNDSLELVQVSTGHVCASSF